jgi:RNA polymerase sigma factor (sigma-70 family)
MTNGRMGSLTRQLCHSIAACDDSGRSDGALLDHYLQTRDDMAFAALVARHGSMVWSVCRRVLRHYHDAEDAFQATFLILASRAESVSPKDRVANWLYGVAHNVARKARARSARQRLRERPTSDLPEPVTLDSEVSTDLRPVLDQELSRLPTQYREAILLCDVDGETQAEAARRLGCPEGTIAARLSRARDLLAARLSRRGVTFSVTGLIIAISAKRAGAVPSELVARTLNVTALANGAMSGVVPDRVAGLTNGGNTTMLWTRLKVIVAALAVAGTVALGGGLLLADRPVPPTDEKRTLGRWVSGDASASAPAENLRRMEGMKWHLLRVDHQKKTLHVADVSVERSWGSDAAERLFASAGSQLSLVGVPVSKDAKIKLDGKEIALKELHDGVNLTLKFETEKAVVVAIEATTPERAGYVVKGVDAEKKILTVSRGKDDKPLVLGVADVVALKEVKPGSHVQLHVEVEDGKLIVKGIRVR